MSAVFYVAAFLFPYIGLVAVNLQLAAARKDMAAERADWAAERRLLMAAAIQPSNPVGAARLQRREPAEPAAPRPTPIGL